MSKIRRGRVPLSVVFLAASRGEPEVVPKFSGGQRAGPSRNPRIRRDEFVRLPNEPETTLCTLVSRSPFSFRSVLFLSCPRRGPREKPRNWGTRFKMATVRIAGHPM